MNITTQISIDEINNGMNKGIFRRETIKNISKSISETLNIPGALRNRTIIYNYLRDSKIRHGKLITRGPKRGILLACKEGDTISIGWSKCCKTDIFNREIAIFLAQQRLYEYYSPDKKTPPMRYTNVGFFIHDLRSAFPNLPHQVADELPRFINKIEKAWIGTKL